jgi:signal transduction histidine kinase
LFDPLVRGDSDDMNRSGMGLGLFIVKQITEAHKGNVSITSTDAGTTVTIRLPIQRP